MTSQAPTAMKAKEGSFRPITSGTLRKKEDISRRPLSLTLSKDLRINKLILYRMKNSFLF